MIIGTKPPPDLWRVAFELAAERVVELPRDETYLADLLAEGVEASAPRAGRVLAVIGGCGGAGASTLATATAVVAARQRRDCLLLDCDPLGGGLDLAVGAEALGGLRWSGLSVSGGRVSVGALHEALPRRGVGSGALTLLSCDRDNATRGRTPGAVRSVIAAGRRAGETVVCDLPRVLDEPAAEAVRQADLTTVIVPAQVRACAAAAGLVTGLRDVTTALSLVVRGPAPGGLKVADVGRAVGLDVLTAMRSQPGLPATLDRSGLCSSGAALRGPLARGAREILTALDGELEASMSVGA